VRLCLCTRCHISRSLTRSRTDARAPSRYVSHTALLALLLALYAIFPPAYVLGPPRLGLPLLSTSTGDAVVQNDLWVRIFAERELVIGTFRLRASQWFLTLAPGTVRGNPLSAPYFILRTARYWERGSV
jgi:hypothetical protein